MSHEVDTDVEDDVNRQQHVKDDNKADWRLLDEILEEIVEATNDESPPESKCGRGQRVQIQQTMYVPGSAEFNGHNNQLLGVLNLQY